MYAQPATRNVQNALFPTAVPILRKTIRNSPLFYTIEILTDMNKEKKDILESIREVKHSLQKPDKYIPLVEERSLDRAEIKEAVKLFRHLVFGNFFGTIDLSTSLSRLYTILSHQV